MSEWKLIETAPRDGTPIDLWIVSADADADHTMIDFYCPHARKVKGKPLREGRVADVQWGHKPPNSPNWYPSGGLMGYPLAADVKPTHWMPRPDAPKLP